MPWKTVEHFFEAVGEILVKGGVLCVYGPFRYGGRYTSKSNARFDQYLKQRDSLSLGLKISRIQIDLLKNRDLILLKTIPCMRTIKCWCGQINLFIRVVFTLNNYEG